MIGFPEHPNRAIVFLLCNNINKNIRDKFKAAFKQFNMRIEILFALFFFMLTDIILSAIRNRKDKQLENDSPMGGQGSYAGDNLQDSLKAFMPQTSNFFVFDVQGTKK